MNSKGRGTEKNPRRITSRNRSSAKLAKAQMSPACDKAFSSSALSLNRTVTKAKQKGKKQAQQGGKKARDGLPCTRNGAGSPERL